MNARTAVLQALNTTCGLMDRPEFVSVIHAGGDIVLTQLDLDSLSVYEIIMSVEDALGIDIKPEVVFGAVHLTDLISAIELIVENHSETREN